MQRHILWRLLALLLSILYVILTSIVILVLLHNVLASIVLILSSLVLVYAAWLLVIGEGARRRAGVIIGLFGLGVLVFDVIFLITDERNRRAIALIGLLTGIYVVVCNVLRRQYWIYMRSEGLASVRIARFKHPFLIINPKSGNGRAIKAGIERLAQAQGIHVIIMQKGDDVEMLARKAATEGADVIGISGGDGSIGAVAKVAIEYTLPVVVLPGGTRCHFARDLGLDPKRIGDALNGFNGIERHIDVASINGRIFLNNVSFGLYAAIIDHPEYRNHKREVTKKVLRSIMNNKENLFNLQFDDGTKHYHKVLQVLVSVNRYTMFNIFEVGDRKRLDEGILQIVAVTDINNNLIRKLVSDVHSHISPQMRISEEVATWTGSSFHIVGDKEKLVVGVDGERVVCSNPVDVTVLPAALRVYVPPEGIRGRPKFGLDPTIFRKAIHIATHAH